MKFFTLTLALVLSLAFCSLAFAAEQSAWQSNTTSSSVYGDLTYYTQSNGLMSNFYMVIPDSQIPANSALGQLNTPGTTYTFTTPFGGTFWLEF
jgi:hypothetical protein